MVSGKVSDCVRKVSDSVRKVFDGVKKVSDVVGKVSEEGSYINILSITLASISPGLSATSA